MFDLMVSYLFFWIFCLFICERIIVGLLLGLIQFMMFVYSRYLILVLFQLDIFVVVGRFYCRFFCKRFLCFFFVFLVCFDVIFFSRDSCWELIFIFNCQFFLNSYFLEYGSLFELSLNRRDIIYLVICCVRFDYFFLFGGFLLIIYGILLVGL